MIWKLKLEAINCICYFCWVCYVTLAWPPPPRALRNIWMTPYWSKHCFFWFNFKIGFLLRESGQKACYSNKFPKTSTFSEPPHFSEGPPQKVGGPLPLKSGGVFPKSGGILKIFFRSLRSQTFGPPHLQNRGAAHDPGRNPRNPGGFGVL